jgi:glycolate oxidase iron-sulfur subunit
MGGWNPALPAPAEEDIVSCVSCGLCLPHCPTFRLTGRETASPRGRIAAMRAVDEGMAEVDSTFAMMMDECLACRACETACPSGVPFGRMVEAARAQVEPTRPLPARRIRRLGLVTVLRRPRLVRMLGRATALAQALRLDRLMPARLAGAMPRMRMRDQLRPLPRSIGSGPTAVLLTGCVMDAAFRPVHRATMRLLARSGYRATRSRGGACCGALSMHYGQPEAAREMARARIAEMESADLIVVNSAGCSGHMKTYGELLADDPAWAERAERMAGRVRDVLELELDPSAVELGPVAMHDACHHLNGQGIAAQPRLLLERAGAEIRELGDGGRCCGAAGLYGIFQPEMSGQLRRQKAEAIARTGAGVVAVGNPGCAIQIEAGLREIGAEVRIAHPVELALQANGARASRRA